MLQVVVENLGMNPSSPFFSSCQGVGHTLYDLVGLGGKALGITKLQPGILAPFMASQLLI